MIYVGIAIFTSILPFLLVRFFNRPLTGILTVSTGLIVFHLTGALISQFFGIFTYPLILSLHILGSSIIISFFIHQKEKFIYMPKISLRFSHLIFGVALLLVLFELWSVRHSYTGTLETYRVQKEVRNFSSPYPQFSDEWSAASLIQYSIDSGKLPLVNPLSLQHFDNPLFPFFSLEAELFLFFHMDPVFDFWIISFLGGIVICLLVASTVWCATKNALATTIALLYAPFITNSANLPGIWFFLPYTAGLIFFLIALSAYFLKETRLMYIALCLSFLLYPPMVIFLLPFLFIILYTEKNRKIFFWGIGILTVSTVGITLFSHTIQNILLSYLIRDNLISGIPSFMPWNIIPLSLLPFALGSFSLFREKRMRPILGAAFIGILYWIVYTQTRAVFIIDYPRIVIITSYLLIITASIFIGQSIIPMIKKKWGEKIVYSSLCVLLAIFVFFSFSYTANSRWKSLPLYLPNPEKKKDFFVLPTAPLHEYLTSDDISIFKDIRNKNFIAPPWKGLVLAVLTHSFPLHTKASTIGNSFYQYNDFMKLDCNHQAEIIQKFHLEYVYSDPINCTYLHASATSSEGLILYRVIPPKK